MAIPPTYEDDWSSVFLRLASDATPSEITWINAQLRRQWPRHDASYWSADRAEAVILYVGHVWELEQGASNVASKAPTVPTGSSTNAWSKQRSAPKAREVRGSDAWFRLTSTGQRYLQLRSEQAGRMPFATGGGW
jgi:hypothetical protein